MSLKSKVLVILIVAVVLYAILDYSIQKWIIFPNFQELERQEAIRSIERALESMRRESQHLNSLCHDWSSWDDTYHFAQNFPLGTKPEKNQKYAESVLLDSSLINDHLNLVCFYDIKGHATWKKALDLKTKLPMGIRQFSDSLPTTHPLMGNGNLESSICGIFMTEKGPMLIASRPILTSNGDGPPQGRLIMGRLINHSIAKMLSSQTQVDCSLISLVDDKVSKEEQSALRRITGKSPFYIHPKNSEIIRAYAVIPDILRNPAILMRIQASRGITAKAEFAIRTALFSLLIISLLILLLLMILLQKFVVGPISSLTAQAGTIGRNPANSLLDLKVQSRDEIGVLAREFNLLLQKLAKAREDLQKQSYYAGMAEMASEVLHNIRNNLGPMIVNIDMLRQNLIAAPVTHLQKANQELITDALPEERKKDILKYQHLAIQKISRHIEVIGNHIEEISACSSRIETVLSERDKFSQASPPMESLWLKEVVQEAISLIPQVPGTPISYEMDDSVNYAAPVLAHRPPFVHVLVNLISNAADSIRNSNAQRGEIRIYAAPETANDMNIIRLRIADNGVGIEPENIERIFEREYPRKNQCSIGLGLHWCSNAISAMNGRIYAESNGKGKGACFHVLIPRSI